MEIRGVRTSAEDLFLATLSSKERIAVLGASGWFGRTLLALGRQLSGAQILAIGSHARNISVEGRRWPVEVFDAQRLADFSPTMVLNFAYLTREKISEVGSRQYLRINSRLTDIFLQTAQLPDVRLGLTVSSGAACSEQFGSSVDTENLYGELKRREEKRAFALSASGRNIVVARAWSVSGCFVQRPENYAFSDLILQSIRGKPTITSKTSVWRRYILVEDFLAVAIAHGLCTGGGILNSGGELIEIHELAGLIRDVLSSQSSLKSTKPSNRDRAHGYFSEGSDWEAACRNLNFQSAPLPEQVRQVSRFLMKANFQ